MAQVQKIYQTAFALAKKKAPGYKFESDGVTITRIKKLRNGQTSSQLIMPKGYIERIGDEKKPVIKLFGIQEINNAINHLRMKFIQKNR